MHEEERRKKTANAADRKEAFPNPMIDDVEVRKDAPLCMQMP